MRFAFLTLGYFPAAIVEGPFDPPPGIQWQILRRTSDELLVAFFGSREEQEPFMRFLNEHRFHPLVWPRGMKGDFPGCRERLRSVLRRTGDRLERLENKRRRLAAAEGDAVYQRLRSIRIGRSLVDIYRQCGFTARVAMIGGWIPGNRLGLLEKVLNEVSPGRYSLHREAASGGQTPVLLSNPRLIRPFERVLAVYGTPTYGELEPTPILAVGFLVLFGMMFGDLGHGMVFILGGLALRQRSRFRDEGCILAEMGVFASFFGILYGSFFGMEHLFEPLWFNPMDNIPAFMAVALALGAGGILVGLLLRVWNTLGNPDAAFFTDPLGLAGLVFYGGAIGTWYLVYRELLPAGSLCWLFLPLVAIFFHPLAARRQQSDIRHGGVLLAEGAVAVLETILGFLANTFSFLRVAAFGLAHVGLASAVIVLAEMTRGWPLGWAWMVAVHVVGNLVILVLEGLVVSIQTVRLEFYEIFSKFFQGGGVIFKPLTLDYLPERSR